ESKQSVETKHVMAEDPVAAGPSRDYHANTGLQLLENNPYKQSESFNASRT
ncbi:13002_t:CDS:1, partial [Dentiscutata heterogama]